MRRNRSLENAAAFVGRKNSGKTTLVTKLISALNEEECVVSSVKHHGHCGFEIDHPGKDSFRHHEAGTRATAVLSPDKFALTEDRLTELSCTEAVSLLPESNIVIIEGFRRAGFPTVELARAENPRDVEAVPTLIHSLESGSAQEGTAPIAFVTNIPELERAAHHHGVPTFGFEDIRALTLFVKERFFHPFLTVAIQAGGESKRMGTSKALVPYLGKPMIEHVLNRLDPLATETIITTNEPDKLEYLKLRYPHVRLIPDDTQSRGALPGLITALSHASHDLVAIAACDMTNVSPELIDYEADVLAKTGAGVCIPCMEGYVEPLSAVYRREPAKRAARAAFESGDRRLRSVVESLDAVYLEPTKCTLVNSLAFTNANTPQELAQAEEQAQARAMQEYERLMALWYPEEE